MNRGAVGIAAQHNVFHSLRWHDQSTRVNDTRFLLFPNQFRYRRKSPIEPAIPFHGSFGSNPSSKINVRHISHHIYVIDGKDFIVPQRPEIRTFRNIVGQHDSILRIMFENLKRGSEFELAGEFGVLALTEVDDLPRRDWRPYQTKFKWFSARPFVDQHVADSSAAAQRDRFTKASVRSGIKDHSGRYSSTSAVMSSRITPPSVNRSTASSRAVCMPTASFLALSRKQRRRRSVSKNWPLASSASVRPSL